MILFKQISEEIVWK